ncbi:hypothetical protein APHAL10511_008264 [Amanita phalloides]|nr:hypothetical protein APHAL10511_008264 [Amanita phalloides]
MVTFSGHLTNVPLLGALPAHVELLAQVELDVISDERGIGEMVEAWDEGTIVLCNPDSATLLGTLRTTDCPPRETAGVLGGFDNSHPESQASPIIAEFAT